MARIGQRISMCLWFDHEAEEAAKFYVSIFENSKIGAVTRYGEGGAKAGGAVGIGHTGSTAGNIAGHVATQAIVTAGTLSANVRSKDEITLEVALVRAGGASVLAQAFKQKAKANGEDVLTGVVGQAAQAVITAAPDRTSHLYGIIHRGADGFRHWQEHSDDGAAKDFAEIMAHFQKAKT